MQNVGPQTLNESYFSASAPHLFLCYLKTCSIAVAVQPLRVSGSLEQHSSEQQPLDLSTPAPHAVSPGFSTPAPRLKPTARRAPLANAPTHPSSARSAPVRSLSGANRFGRAQVTPMSTGALKRGSTKAVDPEVGIISREIFDRCASGSV
eukprot:scaffold228062_cov17-Tisochrysis_lutea.AAC.2